MIDGEEAGAAQAKNQEKQKQSLALTTRCHPPIARAGDADQEVLVRLDLSAQSGQKQAELDLALVVVGCEQKGLVLESLPRVISALREGDRLHLNDGTRLIHWHAGGEPFDHAALVTAPVTSLASALDRGREALEKQRRKHSTLRLLVVVTEPPSENVEALLRATAAVTELSIGVDFFTVLPSVDVGLLTQVANLVGGEVFALATVDQTLADAMAERVLRLAEQTATDVRVELVFASAAQPRRLFRLQPRPAFLGNIRFSPEQPRLVFDAGPVTRSAPPSFLLSVGAPRRRDGRYRLFETRVHHRYQGSPGIATLDTVQSYSKSLDETSYVDAAVVCALDRVEPTAWIEEAAMSYSESDHRRVAGTLERLMRRFLELGAPEGRELVQKIRGHYLRSGVLALADFNALRVRAALIAAHE